MPKKKELTLEDVYNYISEAPTADLLSIQNFIKDIAEQRKQSAQQKHDDSEKELSEINKLKGGE